jgi:putative hydrolases of HD superfamily
MNDSVDSLLSFISFTHLIRNVKRAMWVLDKEQFENDSEHSFQVAIVALYIIEQNDLPLDPYKCMAMAIVHDILEVHSGDTHIYGKKADLDSKKEREQAAIAKLKVDWPKLTLMHELIEEYESKQTPESKFIYALDKLVPMLNNYLDGGRNWKRERITLDRITGAKAGKIEIDETVFAYYQTLVARMKDKPELFA